MTIPKEDLWKVANLYYNENLTQAEIARHLSISHSTVSRMLNRARTLGIVRISIIHPLGRKEKLETLLKNQFNVEEVRVGGCESENEQECLAKIGALAANYLEEILANDQTIAITWGRTILKLVQSLDFPRKYRIKVVQGMGATGAQNPNIDGPDIVREFARAVGGHYFQLHAPLVVGDSHSRTTLMNEPSNYKTLTMARNADFLLTGIGTFLVSKLVWEGFLSEGDYSKLVEAGATGFIFGHHFDEKGVFIDSEWNNLVIGIEPDDLKTIKKVIAVSGGRKKAKAILGALRGELIDVLITDEYAATEILRISDTD